MMYENLMYENLVYDVFVIITSIAAGLMTQELSIARKWGAVKASAFVSLAFGLVFYFLAGMNLPVYIHPLLSPAAMGASFVAMSSQQTIPTRKWMLVGSALFAILFILAKPALDGYGGLLGTGACASVVMTIGMIRLNVALKK